jgi:hypothetical protein
MVMVMIAGNPSGIAATASPTARSLLWHALGRTAAVLQQGLSCLPRLSAQLLLHVGNQPDGLQDAVGGQAHRVDAEAN